MRSDAVRVYIRYATIYWLDPCVCARILSIYLGVLNGWFVSARLPALEWSVSAGYSPYHGHTPPGRAANGPQSVFVPARFSTAAARPRQRAGRGESIPKVVDQLPKAQRPGKDGRGDQRNPHVTASNKYNKGLRMSLSYCYLSVQPQFLKACASSLK